MTAGTGGLATEGHPAGHGVGQRGGQRDGADDASRTRRTRPAIVAFDADDTLWHNERFFRMTQDRFAALLSDHTDPDLLKNRLVAAERRNLGRYGYGIKGFVLSMIETALDVTGDRVAGQVIRQLVDAGHEMLAHPIELLPHARAGVEAARATGARVIVVTKGDLMDQERKVAQSGLGDLLDGVEIVSEKTAATYRAVFARHGVAPGSAAGAAAMVGNSIRSDVRPAIEAGAWGVHVPHDLTWEHEHEVAPEDHPRFRRIADLGALASLLDDLEREGRGPGG